MDHLHLLLILLSSMVVAVSAANGTTGEQDVDFCSPTSLASRIHLSCVEEKKNLFLCCQAVIAAVDMGGDVPCLCRVVAERRLIADGLSANDLLMLFVQCNAVRPGGANLEVDCAAHAR
uniref:Uncharacterized protein n=1 Tax=Avena sativa TaxID=4498 RepID=A0ACD5U326_AVESA